MKINRASHPTFFKLFFRLALISSLLFSQMTFSQELKQFLKSCGYGTLAGAGLGLASLVFEKKPNESYGNIARGASLGLYGGMAYGLFTVQQQNAAPKDDLVLNSEESLYYIFPTIDGKIETLFVLRF